jgi:TRAP-type C4-dicarboxylate transport system permease small subunit
MNMKPTVRQVLVIAAGVVVAVFALGVLAGGARMARRR